MIDSLNHLKIKSITIYRVRCLVIPGEQVTTVKVPFDMTWDDTSNLWHGKTTSELADRDEKKMSVLSTSSLQKPIVITGHEVNGYRVLPNAPIYASKWCSEQDLQTIESDMIQSMMQALYDLGRSCRHSMQQLNSYLHPSEAVNQPYKPSGKTFSNTDHETHQEPVKTIVLT